MNRINVLLLCTASVVEIGIAREIIYRIGRGARREPNHLVVLTEQRNYSLYVNPKDDSVKELARLYVDEGRHDDCLNPTFVYGPAGLVMMPNRSWEEMVDATELARLVCDVVDPDHAYTPTGLSGRGSHKRAMQAQYLEVMRAKTEMLRTLGFRVEELGFRVEEVSSSV